MKNYHWNEDTLRHFKLISNYTSRNEILKQVVEFVEIDCQLEEGDTEKDLVENLMNKIYIKENK